MSTRGAYERCGVNRARPRWRPQQEREACTCDDDRRVEPRLTRSRWPPSRFAVPYSGVGFFWVIVAYRSGVARVVRCRPVFKLLAIICGLILTITAIIEHIWWPGIVGGVLLSLGMFVLPPDFGTIHPNGHSERRGDTKSD